MRGSGHTWVTAASGSEWPVRRLRGDGRSQVGAGQRLLASEGGGLVSRETFPHDACLEAPALSRTRGYHGLPGGSLVITIKI